MKIILMTVMFIFILKTINAKQSEDDSPKSSTLNSAKLSEVNTPVTGINTTSFPNKTKKFMVALKQPVKISYSLPKRTLKKFSVPKVQIEYNAPNGKIGVFPVLSTKRPHLMKTKQFISKPHAIALFRSAKLSEVNTPVTGINTRSFPNKTKKFMVTLKQPVKTSYSLPKRTLKKFSVPKVQIEYNAPNGKIGVFPVLSTKRPHLMKTKQFISKPHAIDRAQELIEINSFNKKRTPSKFNQFKTEDTLKNVDKKEYKTEDPENFEERFKNFTDMDISSENDSDESKENIKPLPRRFIKGAASLKVTTIASPPITNAKAAKNYKIKDLLKNQKYMPQVERKKMAPVLALQKSEITANNQNEEIMPAIQISKGISENNLKLSTNKNDYSSEEKADQNEFIFIKEYKHKSTTTTPLSPEDDEIVTMDTIDDADVRQERSVNVIEEESVATTSGAKFTAKDWPMSLEFAYKNIHT